VGSNLFESASQSLAETICFLLLLRTSQWR